MKKLFKGILFLFALLISAVSWSQTKTVTGTVKGQNGEPVSKASVVVKGSQAGTSTNERGEFTITVPSTAQRLIITSVGFEAKEVAITGTTLVVSLTENTTRLNEVVVVGYGSKKEKSTISNYTTIQENQLNVSFDIDIPSIHAFRAHNRAPYIRLATSSSITSVAPDRKSVV